MNTQKQIGNVNLVSGNDEFKRLRLHQRQRREMLVQQAHTKKLAHTLLWIFLTHVGLVGAFLTYAIFTK